MMHLTFCESCTALLWGRRWLNLILVFVAYRCRKQVTGDLEQFVSAFDSLLSCFLLLLLILRKGWEGLRMQLSSCLLDLLSNVIQVNDFLTCILDLLLSGIQLSYFLACVMDLL